MQPSMVWVLKHYKTMPFRSIWWPFQLHRARAWGKGRGHWISAMGLSSWGTEHRLCGSYLGTSLTSKLRAGWGIRVIGEGVIHVASCLFFLFCFCFGVSMEATLIFRNLLDFPLSCISRQEIILTRLAKGDVIFTTQSSVFLPDSASFTGKRDIFVV